MIPEYTVMTVAGMVLVIALELSVFRAASSDAPSTGPRWRSASSSNASSTAG